MPLRAQLVNVTPNELVYLITNTGSGGEFPVFETSMTISASDAGSPDLATDCVDSSWGSAACSRLRAVCRAGLDGLGNVAAGAWTQVQARDLLLGNGLTQVGGPLMPRAELQLHMTAQVAGIGAGALLPEADVDVDADGIPEINITTAGVGGQAILRVRLRSTPGVR